MTTFRDLPTFATGINGFVKRGTDACRLTGAMKGVPEAHPAAVALGDPHLPARRAKALRLLEALPAKARSRILAAYDRNSTSAEATHG